MRQVKNGPTIEYWELNAQLARLHLCGLIRLRMKSGHALTAAVRASVYASRNTGTFCGDAAVAAESLFHPY